ncbi:MAG TPA: hypothetical protein VK737_02835, partial [Opitutales bacterium]|nr:hypothetical protein [Opitutales bacterium]
MPLPAHPPESATMRTAFTNAGQGQIFQFWEKLTTDEQSALCAQAAEIDLAEIAHLVDAHLRGKAAESVDFSKLRP